MAQTALLRSCRASRLVEMCTLVAILQRVLETEEDANKPRLKYV